MYLTAIERLDAESRGERAGSTRDGLYDSTPPHFIGPCPKRAQEWRDGYRKGFNLARHKRGI